MIVLPFLADAVDPSSPIIEWIRTGGTVGVLAAAVVAFLRGWVVPGSTHRQVLSERDKALELVYKQAEVAQRSLDLAERRASR